MEIAAARVSQEIYGQIPLQAVYQDVAEPNSLQRREEMLFRMLGQLRLSAFLISNFLMLEWNLHLLFLFVLFSWGYERTNFSPIRAKVLSFGL